MATINISEPLIRQFASPNSFSRGQDYFRRGAVQSISLRGPTLQAEVQGSEPYPYQVRVTLGGSGIVEAHCSCPYGLSYSDFCKHIVATLLTAIENPQRVEERPALEEVIAGLDRDDLQAILLRLVERDPALALTVESLAAVRPTDTGAGEPAGHPAPTSIDPEVFRQRVRSSLRQAPSMYGDPYGSFGYGYGAGDIDDVLQDAWALTRSGRAHEALEILSAITDEYLNSGTYLEYYLYEEESGVLWELGPAWAEALLSVDLPAEEREDWAHRLDVWDTQFSEYGLDDILFDAVNAARQGWDDPELVAILRGDIADIERPPVDLTVNPMEDWDEWEIIVDNRPAGVLDSPDLTVARLNVLERQERYEEYLNLAAASGMEAYYLKMLVATGRSEKAIERALSENLPASMALDLAAALAATGETEPALRVAEHGLKHPGDDFERESDGYLLAVWLRDAAAAHGEVGLARRAAMAAIEFQPGLEAYLRLRDLAGDQWPAERLRLLNKLDPDAYYFRKGLIDIYLHEGMVDRAIEAVKGQWDPALTAEVADAAAETHPEWVIDESTRRADEIMDAGKADRYHYAAEWVARAKRAYLALGREPEWREFLEERIERHRRKYKLRPMLEALRG
jgi:uncharacterized Zn finger protein